MTNAETVLTIDHVGHRGDGIAQTPEGPVYVPFTLAGERVSVRRDGTRTRLLDIDAPSPDRTEPACPHFGSCGGCSLQHMAAPAYRAWKRDQVVSALHQRGIEAEVDALVPSAPQTRRRAVLTARRTGRALHVGYHERQSHAVIDVSACPVLAPEIVRALPALRDLAAITCPRKGTLRLTVLSTDGGLDIALADAAKITPREEQKLISLAMTAGFARLSLDGEVLITLTDPALSFSGVAVVPPPGTFTQASAIAEEAMAALVTEAIAGATHVADLFSGAGTFALRLARSTPVHAVEGDRSALAALEHGMRHAQGLKPVTTEVRDLFDYPLTKKELKAFDTVVFDPPRAGAKAQAEVLATSDVGTIVAVSCNPATLARDLRVLIDGGYRLYRITPIDQFLWSPHIECVAVLSRDTP